MDIYLASFGIVPKGDFKVGLPIISRGRGDASTLDFTVKASTASNTPPTLNANSATITVLSTSLSPVRAYVNVKIVRNEGISELEFDFLLADWRDAVLVDAEGNPLSTLSEFFISAQQEGESASYSFTFLPTDAQEAYIAPTIIDGNDQKIAFAGAHAGGAIACSKSCERGILEHSGASGADRNRLGSRPTKPSGGTYRSTRRRSCRR